MDNNLNDIDLIAGADSPFDPWVRDAVRNLRDENAALKAEIALMHGAADYDDITEYEYAVRLASAHWVSDGRWSSEAKARAYIEQFGNRLSPVVVMRRRKAGPWEEQP